MPIESFLGDNYNNCMDKDKVTKNHTFLMKVYWRHNRMDTFGFKMDTESCVEFRHFANILEWRILYINYFIYMFFKRRHAVAGG
jgi:hypothetical protein